MSLLKTVTGRAGGRSWSHICWVTINTASWIGHNYHETRFTILLYMEVDTRYQRRASPKQRKVEGNTCWHYNSSTLILKKNLSFLTRCGFLTASFKSSLPHLAFCCPISVTVHLQPPLPFIAYQLTLDVHFNTCQHFLSVAGWLRLWLLITEAIPAGIHKHEHSCPALHRSPLSRWWQVMSHMKLFEQWATSLQNKPTPRKRLPVGTTTWTGGVLWDYKEPSRWLTQANRMPLEPRETLLWQPRVQPIKHKPRCVLHTYCMRHSFSSVGLLSESTRNISP